MGRNIVRRAARLVGGGRTIAPELMHAPLSEAGLAALLAHCRIRTSRSPEPLLVPAALTVLPVDGFYRLVLDPALNDHAALFYALRSVAQLWPTRPCQDLVAASLFGLGGVLDYAGIKSRGPRYLRERVDGLAAVPEFWHVAPLPSLLDLLNRVYPLVVPACAPRVADVEPPRQLYDAGWNARVNEDYGQAEEKYMRAASVAAAEGDGEVLVLALVGRGRVCQERGQFARSRRHLLRALRAVREHEVRAVRVGLEREVVSARGLVLHHLTALAAEQGHDCGVVEYATAAAAAYGRGNGRLPMLAHDIAVFWLRYGAARRAKPVLAALLPHFVAPDHRLKVLGNLARAAGTDGDQKVFEAAARDVRALVEQGCTEEAAAAYNGVARGALSLGMWDLAAAAASEASRAATRRGEAAMLLEAEGSLAQAARRVRDWTTPRRLNEKEERRGDELAAMLVAELSEFAPGL